MREITVFVIHTTTTYKVRTSKNKSKRKSLRHNSVLSFSLLYLLVCHCKFVVIEICAYDIADDEKAMNSLIIQKI